MNFRAVLFDLDGTLLDTLEDLAHSVNRVLAARGLPGHPVEAYRYFVGEGITMLIRRALPPERRDEATIEKCRTEFERDYGNNWHIRTRPYEGVPAMLDRLTELKVPMTIVSNKPDAFTKLCVAQLLASWRFGPVFGKREGIPRKPDPAGALEATRMLDVEPRNVIYLGDTGTDMQAASAAGMYGVGALWGFRDREELRNAGAKKLLERPQRMLDFFE
jgi:phosphoglycolate phosphatase